MLAGKKKLKKKGGQQPMPHAKEIFPFALGSPDVHKVKTKLI